MQGNFIGTDATGAATLGTSIQNTGVDVFAASNNLIGGASSGRTTLSPATPRESRSTVLFPRERRATPGGALHWHGCDPAHVVGNGEGVAILAASGNLIGGAMAGEGNVISGNSFKGVDITGVSSVSATNNFVRGNFIGTDATGEAALPNHGDGIFINGRNTIGGTAAGAGNLITNNTGNGVTVSPVIDTEVAILGNSIFGNTKEGIDLGDDGVTPNDPGDADIGPNDLQNFPVLTFPTTPPASRRSKARSTAQPTRPSRSSSSPTRSLTPRATTKDRSSSAA